jgi:WD40 repeat protein
MKKIIFILQVFIFSYSLYSQNIELGVNTGQTEEVYLAKFSPDEKQFITCGQNTISIWDSRSGKLIRNIVNEGGVITIEFTKDGKHMVVVPLQNSIRCFELSTGKIKYEISKSKVFYQSQTSFNGKFTALSSDSTIDIIDPTAGEVILSTNPSHGFITNIRFSPDNSKFYFTSTDSSLFIYDLESRKQISRTKNTDRIWRMCISNNSKQIALADRSKIISIWTADGTKKINQFSSVALQHQVQFIDHDQKIIGVGKDSIIRIWNVQSGIIEKTIYIPQVYNLNISADQTRALISDASDYIKTIALPDGRIIDSFACHKGYVKEAIYNSDATKILSFSYDRSAIVWDAGSKKPLAISTASEINIMKAIFANDLKSILLVDKNESYTLWEKSKGLRNSTAQIALDSGLMSLFKLYCPKTLFNGKYILNAEGFEVKLMDPGTLAEAIIFKGHRSYINHAEFNQTGDQVVSCSDDSTTVIWNAQSGKSIFILKGHQGEVRDVEFSKDGTKLITGGSGDNIGIIWDVATGKQLFVLTGHTAFIENVGFNYKGDQVATQSGDGTIKVWNVSNGKLLYTLKYERILDAAFAFSPDDKLIASHTAYNVISLFDATTGNKLHELTGHKSVITDYHFSQDSKQMISTSWDRTCKLWDPQIGKEILTFMNLPNNEWLVLHPSGLFDASASAMEKLYWVQGLDIIDFTQLKDRFYEPGLWVKIIKGEELREVKGLNEKLPLYPDIKLYEIDSKGNLKIELANRGGGIGKVKVYINGKELADDVRGEKFNPEAAAAIIVQNVKDHPFLIKGDSNLIEVKAYNKDNWVLSRSEALTYVDKRTIEQSTPELFVISIGVSDYSGKDIDLKFPSKDASDMCSSIQIGAKRLFGMEQTHGYLLNSTSEIKPTKENIKNIFLEVSKLATSSDVVVVYLSGHGINWGGDEGDWFYLTQDAFSASSEAYNDEAIRSKSGVSSKELSDWVKSIPALKQVLIIDACASGRIVDDLVSQRDIPSNTIRSLDRMKDRTGLHIITGCAADAVSFEASRYGQGVLTYSLLEGMKGLSLREGKFIDIIQWFQYARERVPALASGIGGIQEPQIISPHGSESFDVGQLNEEDKKLIPLSNIKPMYVRSNFQDEDDLDDVLALGDKMDEALNEFSSKGIESTIVFVDVKEFPEAYKLIGRYKRENNQVILTLKVKQGTEIIANVSITGTNAEDVVNQLLKKINDF